MNCKTGKIVPSARSWLLRAIVSPLLAMCVCDRAAAQCAPENVGDMIRRATVTIQADWGAFPGFAFVERDAETAKHVTTVRTHRVFMIEGSDYYMPIALNDKPYTAEQLAQEHEKLVEEVGRRSHETEKERQRRSERYWKERNQTRILLGEYVKAFDFTVIRSPFRTPHFLRVPDGNVARYVDVEGYCWGHFAAFQHTWFVDRGDRNTALDTTLHRDERTHRYCGVPLRWSYVVGRVAADRAMVSFLE